MSLLEKIRSKETLGFVFKPSNSWYKEIGIGKKRFWQILREEQSPTIQELETIARHFGLNIQEVIKTKLCSNE